MPGLRQRPERGIELKGQQVHGGAVADMDTGVGRWHAAELTLNEEEAVLVAGARVSNEPRLNGVERLDAILKR